MDDDGRLAVHVVCHLLKMAAPGWRFTYDEETKDYVARRSISEPKHFVEIRSPDPVATFSTVLASDERNAKERPT